MAFTKFDVNVENITVLPDEPSQEDGYTAAKIKSLFDKASVDLKNYINNTLVPQLEAAEASSRIGSESISGLSAEQNVFSQISALKALIDEIKEGGVNDGSITPDKLDSETQKFISSFKSQCIVYKVPGSYAFTAPGNGIYKVTVMGGGAAGSHSGGGMSGAYGVKWFTLTKGQSLSVTVGAGGKLLDECGGDSAFGEMIAQGGMAYQDDYTTLSACTNADIGIDGVISVTESLSDNPARQCGGDSPLGRGSKLPTHLAGIGAGGFGDTGLYSNGGNGMVIIEYTNIQ